MGDSIYRHKLSESDIRGIGERNDPLTFETFEKGIEVVVCSNCNCLQLYETWIEYKGENYPNGPCCFQCKCTDSKQFRISEFKTQDIHIGKHRFCKRISIKCRSRFLQFFQRLQDALANLKLLDKIFDICLANNVFKYITIFGFCAAISLSFSYIKKGELDIAELKNRVYMSMELVVKENTLFAANNDVIIENLQYKNSLLGEKYVI